MPLEPHHIDLGEFYTRGVGGWDEYWYSLVFDSATSELLVWKFSSTRSGLSFSSDEELRPLRSYSRGETIYERAVEHLQKLAAKDSS